MISVKDLRIGNLVQHIEGEILPIASLHFDNTLRLQKGNDSMGCYSELFIKPIALTEDWLNKFGLVYEAHNSEKQKTHCGIEIPCGNTVGFYFKDGKPEITNTQIYSDGMDLINLPPLQYVHQLQNLYYSLTGQELTIKETAPQ